jgi:hypothetical protein
VTDSAVEALRVAVDRLSDRAAGLEQRLSSQTRALWWAIAGPGVVMAAVILVGLAVLLDNHSQIEEANKRWCPLVGLLLPEPGETPPATERGRRIVEEAQVLFRDFGCSPATPPKE